MIRVSSFFLILVLLFSCSRKVSGLGSSENCVANSTKSHYLCQWMVKNEKSGQESIKYQLMNSNSEVLLEGYIENGYVKWLDDKSIELFETPGMMPTELTKDDLIKVYYLKSQKYSTKKEYLESK